MKKENNFYPADKTPPWKDPLNQEILDSKDFQKIFFFFTVFTPCPGLSSREKTVESYGWSNPWKHPFFLNKQLQQVTKNKKLVYVAESYNLLEILQESGLEKDFPNNLNSEKICIYDTKSNHYLSIFYHIRNSFAHGRFNIAFYNDEQVFIFEDVVKKEKAQIIKLSARMILRKSTLLRWIQIIEAGEKPYKREG